MCDGSHWRRDVIDRFQPVLVCASSSACPRLCDLLSLLARLHHDFTLIHPFDDGNGRVVRLLLNAVLLRVGLLPLVIRSPDRRRYLDVIAQSDAGDSLPLRLFLGESLRWSLELGLSAVQGMVELNPYADSA